MCLYVIVVEIRPSVSSAAFTAWNMGPQIRRTSKDARVCSVWFSVVQCAQRAPAKCFTSPWWSLVLCTMISSSWMFKDSILSWYGWVVDCLNTAVGCFASLVHVGDLLGTATREITRATQNKGTPFLLQYTRGRSLLLATCQNASSFSQNWWKTKTTTVAFEPQSGLASSLKTA